MLKEYFEIYTEQRKEYGDNTVVLYQNGAFMEVYERDQHYDTKDKMGNAQEISVVLNDIKYTGKYIGKTTYINFIGFNIGVLDKFLPMLLGANYTVIIVNELESSKNRTGKGNLKRGITNIYSPSLLPIDYNKDNIECNLISIMMDITESKSRKKNAIIIKTLNVSICCVNNITNDIEISENKFVIKCDITACLDELSRVLYRYFPKEIQIKLGESITEEIIIKNYFENDYDNVRIGSYNSNTLMYQNAFLKNVYNHINFGLLSPVEYILKCEEKSLNIDNFICTLEFMGKHDQTYIKNLNLPKIIEEESNLILELNTVSQLNIIDSVTSNKTRPKSVFDVINYTKTAIGKRHLRNLLCKPFKDSKIIFSRYLITEELSEYDLDKFLPYIIDFERLHRKMGLQLLHQYEFVKLHKCYQKIIELLGLFNRDTTNIPLLSINLMKKFNEYINNYTLKFDLNKLSAFNLNSSKDEIQNYFNVNVVPELDIIQIKIDKLENERKSIRLKYDSLINKNKDVEFIKLIYTEMEGYSFSTTKIRYQMLLKKLKENNDDSDFKIKSTNNAVKFFPNELVKISNEIISNRDLLACKIKLHYIKYITEFYSEYNDIFTELKNIIEIIDVCNSNLKCKQKYNYTQPILINDKTSQFEAIALRHPIIERLGREYISNDITLDNNNCGMLLYGINSSGKSSMLRAIGVNVILAQCGLYVPCKKFKFSPFDTIISQVDLSDNLFSGKSSFINEMIGLKRILEVSNNKKNNCLILCDELLRGTENNSACSLVTATILQLINNNSKFFFTSHIHSILKIKEIQELTQLQIKHLSVSTINNQISFERKLKDGGGSELYGIEVAKSILQDSLLIDKAFEIRNILLNSPPILNNKKSIYNKQKIIDKCEICESTIQLETDHILEQATADIKGFLKKGISKNHLSNLCCLCHECHLKKTLGKIKIYGYKSSLNGTFLHYEKIE
jgi:DNA mismatch repair protein MutS